MRWPSAWWISTLSLHIISHDFLAVFLRVLNRKGNQTFEHSGAITNRHWTTRNFCTPWYTRQESTAVPLKQIWLQGPSTSAASLRVTSDPPSCYDPGVATGSPGRRPSNGVAPKPGAFGCRWMPGNLKAWPAMIRKLYNDDEDKHYVDDSCLTSAVLWLGIVDGWRFMVMMMMMMMMMIMMMKMKNTMEKKPFAGWPWIYWTIYGTLHTADTSAAIFIMCQIDLFPVLTNCSPFLYQGAGCGR